MEQPIYSGDGGQGTRGLSRRGFLGLVWWGAAGIVLVESGVASVVSLWPKPKAGGFGVKFRINVSDLPKEVGDLDATYLSTGKFYLVRVENGILALYRKCTHLGCVTPWRPNEKSEDGLSARGRFNCPCHGSIFDRHGLVRGGPAPRPLDLFKVTVERNEIVVDTGTVIQRIAFDPSQVTRV